MKENGQGKPWAPDDDCIHNYFQTPEIYIILHHFFLYLQQPRGSSRYQIFSLAQELKIHLTRIYAILYYTILTTILYYNEYSVLIPLYSDWKSIAFIYLQGSCNWKTSNKPVQHVVWLRWEGGGMDNLVIVWKTQHATTFNMYFCIYRGWPKKSGHHWKYG